MAKLKNPDPLETVRRLFAAIEAGEVAALDLYAPDIEQIEHANALKPRGEVRGLAKMHFDFERGRKVLRQQSYEIRSALVDGDHVAVQVLWTGELAIAMGNLKPGDKMRAQSAMFFTLSNGKIVAQENYDCFEPLAQTSG